MSKRLLVVDDDPGLLRAVAETLRAEGYEVRTARRGAEALVSIAGSLPDLIISDIRMPGMDGYELVRHLRSSPRTKLIPVVFLTVKDETADRIAGYREMTSRNSSSGKEYSRSMRTSAGRSPGASAARAARS